MARPGMTSAIIYLQRYQEKADSRLAEPAWLRKESSMPGSAQVLPKRRGFSRPQTADKPGTRTRRRLCRKLEFLASRRSLSEMLIMAFSGGAIWTQPPHCSQKKPPHLTTAD